MVRRIACAAMDAAILAYLLFLAWLFLAATPDQSTAEADALAVELAEKEGIR